jgi:hypothetical protein
MPRYLNTRGVTESEQPSKRVLSIYVPMSRSMCHEVCGPVDANTPAVLEGLVDLLHELVASLYVCHVEAQRVPEVRHIVVRLWGGRDGVAIVSEWSDKRGK